MKYTQEEWDRLKAQGANLWEEENPRLVAEFDRRFGGVWVMITFNLIIPLICFIIWLICDFGKWGTYGMQLLGGVPPLLYWLCVMLFDGGPDPILDKELKEKEKQNR